MDAQNTTSQQIRYSGEDLEEFEQIISEKLENTKSELKYIKETLSRTNDQGTEMTASSMKVMENNADYMEKENLMQLASRLQKFMIQLEKSLTRIKNGTYGVCIETGKLIPKARLRLVPHTQHSIEAKMKNQ